jgi:protein TonB
MTLAMPTTAFEGLPHHRPARAPRTPSARAASIGIAVGAHLVVLAALVYGISVAEAPKAEKPIFVEMVKDQKKEDFKPLPPPKFVAPPDVTVPPPMIDITQPQPASTITVTPPRPPAPPAPAAPVQVAPPAWNGQANYYASLLTYLERFKQYPSAARAAHVEGQVFVHFVMTRDGTVTLAEIAKSSGRPALDREALAMIQRAGKLPPMPGEIKGETLNGVIGPITFELH